MPINQLPNKVSTPPNLSITHRLRIKILSSLILVAIFSPTLTSLLILHSFTPVLYIFPIVFSVITGVLIILFLKPINDLYESAKVFAKGEFSHRINIHSGDEIEQIAQEFNKMAENLASVISNLNNDKNILSFEQGKLNAIISSISDGIFVFDLHHQVLLANTAAQSLVGFTLEEMRRQPGEQFFKLISKDGTQVSLKAICPVDRNEPHPTTSNDETLTLIGKNNKRAFVKIRVSSIDYQIQSDLACVLVLHDVTKEHDLSSIQLDFVSMASHELRTPLTSIIGYLSVFMDENRSKLEASQKAFLDRISISAKQLASLIDNLLSVSKVERGALNMTAAPLDWTKTLTQAVHENQLQALQKNITLQLKLSSGNTPFVLADPIRINEVINNLIGNAINYTQGGGKITVSAKVEGSEVITSVSDTGIGIPPEAISHLFTKFFRVSGALDKSSNSKGTGLGLYISKSIIDLHHGRIWVESTLGKGSTFYFSVPIASGEAKLNHFPTSNLLVR